MIKESKLQCKEQNWANVKDTRGETDNGEETDDEIRSQFKPWEEHEKGKRLQGIFKWKLHLKQEKERSSQEETKKTTYEVKVKNKAQTQKCKDTICEKIRKVLLSRKQRKGKAKNFGRVSKERQESPEQSGCQRRTFPSEKPQERKKDRKMNTVKCKIGQQEKNLSKEQGGGTRAEGTCIGNTKRERIQVQNKMGEKARDKADIKESDTRRWEAREKRETVYRGENTSTERKASMPTYIEENGNRQVYIEERDVNWKDQCFSELVQNNNNIEEITKQKLVMSGIERNPGPNTKDVPDPRKWAGPSKFGGWTYLTCDYDDPEDRCKTSNQLSCNMCLKRADQYWARIKQKEIAEFENMKLVNFEEESKRISPGDMYTFRKLKWTLSCWGPANGCESVIGDLIDISPEEVRWARMEAEKNKTVRKHRLTVSSKKAHYRNMWKQMIDAKPWKIENQVPNPKLWEMMKTVHEKKNQLGGYHLKSQLSDKKLAAHYSSYHQDCWADNASDDEEKGRESEQEFNLLTMNGRDRQAEMAIGWIEKWTGKKMKERCYYYRSGEAYLEDHEYKTFLESKNFKERINVVKRILMSHPSPIKQGPFILPMNLKKGDGANSSCLNGGTPNTFRQWTTFWHPDDQPCRTWLTKYEYIEDTVDPSVPIRYFASSIKPRSRLEGPAQKHSNGRHYYPCNRGGCWIVCRCKLCTGQHGDTHYDEEKKCNETDDEDEEIDEEEEDEKEDDDKEEEQDRTCYKCLGQCKSHEIKLKRSFNSETDSFSLAVSGVDFKHQTPPVCYERHPGIPRECWRCQLDL